MKQKKNPDETVLTARIDSDLHLRVKSKLSAAGSSFQELITRAVTEVDSKSEQFSGTLRDYNEIELDPSKITRYNFPRVVDAAKKAVTSLRAVAAEIETALEIDVATTENPGRLERALLAAEAKVPDAIGTADAAAEGNRRIKDGSGRGEQRGNRRSSGGAA